MRTLPFPETASLVRNPGHVLEEREGRYVVKARHRRTQRKLNGMAAYLWLLCDGARSIASLTEELCALYPDQRSSVRRDVPRALMDLYALGLLAPQAGEPDRPLVKVGFDQFGPRFDERDNYFLWMLTHAFDVWLVAGEDALADADLIVCSAPSRRLEREERPAGFRVLFTEDHDPALFSLFDYIISSSPVDGAHAHRHYQLPVWALYLDWSGYDRDPGLAGERAIPDRYRPERLCAHLHEAYARAPHGDESTAPRVPPRLRAAPEPTSGSDTAPLESTERGTDEKVLTIGMATYEDYDGVYFSLQALRLYHPEVMDEVDLLVVDNNPEGICGPSLRALTDAIGNCRYVPNRSIKGTAVRDLIFRESRTPFTLCMDSHVLLAPGSLQRLIEYLAAHPRTGDLLQGPLVSDDLHTLSTHFRGEWHQGMLGGWELDDRGKDEKSPPFEIPLQGLGVFACRTQAWPGFNPRFRGFGGEEGYLHEKFRRQGGRTLCLPFLRWLHRFDRPYGPRYATTWQDRLRNHFIGFSELGLDTTELTGHFEELLGEHVVGPMMRDVRAEMESPFFFFDAIYCINLDSATERWAEMQKRFARLGIAHRVRRFPAIETPESHHIGCTLSHRRIVEEADRQGLANVLVFEDDAIFLQGTGEHLKANLPELEARDWQLFYLGGHRWGRRFARADGCSFLRKVDDALTSSHAVAYHSSVYSRILDEIPNDIDELKEWLPVYRAIDQYLCRIEHRFLADPVLASQPVLLPQERAEHRDLFTI